MENRLIRLGLIGLGWGEQVAAAARTVPDVEIAACYARNEQKRRAFAASFDCKPCDRYEDLLADPEIDGILIMTPNSHHRDYTLMAAQAGKHVLVTKPIANTLVSGQEMIRACEAAGIIFAVGHQSRREPGIRRLKALIESGDLGDLALIEANSATATGLHIEPGDWRWSREECPGGPLLQLGIHQIDNLQYLFGAVARAQSWQRRALASAEIEDVICCLLEFESGLTGTLTCSYVSSESRCIKVYGTAANALYDRPVGLSVSRDVWNVGAARQQLVGAYVFAEPIPTLQEEIDEFARCIRTGKAPEIDGVQGLQALAVVLAAVESHRTGLPVYVKDLIGQSAGEHL